jgi:hypothetical protein
MLTAVTTTVSTLSWSQALGAAGILAGVSLLAGCIVIYGRGQFLGTAKKLRNPNLGNSPASPAGGGSAGQSTTGSDGDFIRSWAAIILVIGLVLFCAFAFAINDMTLRSTLIGGLIASVGSAIAFYFSSKAADKARQDVANAANIGTQLVPSLIGQTKAAASQILGQTSFSLIEDPARPQGNATDVVDTQNPIANSNAPGGSSVVVSFRTLADARPGAKDTTIPG